MGPLLCALDGSVLHTTRAGYWECAADRHRWHRWGEGPMQGQWKLLKTFRPKSARAIRAMKLQLGHG